MTGETERSPSGWTIDTLKVLSDERERFSAERAIWQERLAAAEDRRYSEVATEREKALAIKERESEKALVLQSENQQYRDEKGNELRAQIERERGSYATRLDLQAAVEKHEAQLKPISDYVTGQQGGPRALTGQTVLAALGAVAVVAGLYFGTRDTTAATTPAVVCTAAYHPAPCP